MRDSVIFEKNGVFSYLRISLLEEFITYEERSFGSTEILKFHYTKLQNQKKFSRIYHIGPALAALFIGVQSLRLLLAEWASFNWKFYLAITPLTFILIGSLYYFFFGRHFGEVILNIDDIVKHLYIREDEYHKLNTNIEKLPKT
jgi:hypothetical protein